ASRMPRRCGRSAADVRGEVWALVERVAARVAGIPADIDEVAVVGFPAAVDEDVDRILEVPAGAEDVERVALAGVETAARVHVDLVRDIEMPAEPDHQRMVVTRAVERRERIGRWCSPRRHHAYGTGGDREALEPARFREEVHDLAEERDGLIAERAILVKADFDPVRPTLVRRLVAIRGGRDAGT